MTIHPEDQRLELESKIDSAKKIGPFFRKHWADFVQLVQVYPDREAQERLDSLRELFWGNLAELPEGEIVSKEYVGRTV